VADLAGALDAALRDRYRVSEVRTPVGQRRGLLARMNQLEKLHARKGDKPGQAATRAAESAGISPRTWRDWRKGTHPPGAASTRKLEGAYNRQITLPAFRKSIKEKKTPTKVNVTATIRWTDSDKKKYNATAYRTVKFTKMGPVMAATIKAWAGAGPEAAAAAFERGVSAMYRVPDTGDTPPQPGIGFEGDNVKIEFP
jgi:hypothetical protein